MRVLMGVVVSIVGGLGCAAENTVLPEPDEAAVASEVDPASLDRFSFFVTSLAALQDLSNSDTGFGGDLRFGETGAGAGLRGADAICATIAERSMTDASSKQWRALLSVTDDGEGNPVDAIDRVGAGPFYDRLGRIVANTSAELQNVRPAGADNAIYNDLPNEDGVPNHAPDGTIVDNHHMITGSDTEGRLYGANATCDDWTSTGSGAPRVGLSWPRGGGGGGGGASSSHWLSAMNESGCAPGVNLIDNGPGNRDGTIGSGGGYGGFYCLALIP